MRRHSYALLALAFPAALVAQDGYRQPPAPIAAILDAAPTPLVSLSPDRSTMLLLARSAMPTIEEVAAPEVRLAGFRLNPRTNAGSRDASYTGITIRPIQGATETRVAGVPAGGRIGNVMWSPDGARIAFTVAGESIGTTLWTAAATGANAGAARRLSTLRMNPATGGPPCRWMGARQLACKTIPAGRGVAPAVPQTPAGPIVQEATGKPEPNRTYQDLLQSPYDETLFEHYWASQLALIGLDGSVKPIGKAGVIAGIDASPDGRWLLVETVHRPFSYLVPMYRFPARYEVWDASGRVAKTIHDRPLTDNLPTSFDAVEPGPRDFAWRQDAPATLAWSEALDAGDPANKAEKRDRLFVLEAPFTGAPSPLIDVETRVANVQWARADLAFVSEYWNKSRRTRTWAVDPSKPGAEPRPVWDRLSEDRYGDPGRLVTRLDARGRPVVALTADGRYAFLSGPGASPEGDRPFLDRLDLATMKAERLWRSEAPYYEEVVALADDQGRRVITRRESTGEPPNYFVRDLGTKSLTQLTRFTDPAPQFAGVTKQLVTYPRKDGVQLSATLYLPPNYDKTRDGRLPFFFWAYPQEFKTAAAAAQVTGSPYRFTRPTGASHLFLLLQGYGVLDGPTMPIVGEGDKEPNDTYVEQLVASAQAAVDKVVELGVADRDRIGVGGHSYGAFMTANLLAHSDLFRAGIARSGAYNRTLTPFGFQAEERPYWQAREIYTGMSPFTFADRIKEPILLIHGMADDNSGTFPIQSERFYAALKGNGARVRYVQLPSEAHGYRARESVGHTLWEMVNWLDTYVKPGKRTATF